MRDRTGLNGSSATPDTIPGTREASASRRLAGLIAAVCLAGAAAGCASDRRCSCVPRAEFFEGLVDSVWDGLEDKFEAWQGDQTLDPSVLERLAKEQVMISVLRDRYAKSEVRQIGVAGLRSRWPDSEDDSLYAYRPALWLLAQLDRCGVHNLAQSLHAREPVSEALLDVFRTRSDEAWAEFGRCCMEADIEFVASVVCIVPSGFEARALELLSALEHRLDGAATTIARESAQYLRARVNESKGAAIPK